MNAFIAGLLIGFGVIINTITKDPIIGACLFSFGLMAVIALQVPLYTGRIGYLNKTNILEMIEYLFFNIIGILAVILIYSYANYNFQNTLYIKSQIKFQKTFSEMFLYGVLCGMLIHFAIKIKREIVTIFAVMIFILIGAEHCIADAPYLFVNFNWIHALKFLCVVLGNSIGAIFIERSLNYEICRNNKE